MKEYPKFNTPLTPLHQLLYFSLSKIRSIDANGSVIRTTYLVSDLAKITDCTSFIVIKVPNYNATVQF